MKMTRLLLLEVDGIYVHVGRHLRHPRLNHHLADRFVAGNLLVQSPVVISNRMQRARLMWKRMFRRRTISSSPHVAAVAMTRAQQAAGALAA